MTKKKKKSHVSGVARCNTANLNAPPLLPVRPHSCAFSFFSLCEKVNVFSQKQPCAGMLFKLSDGKSDPVLLFGPYAATYVSQAS